jgi:hypothetical protein
MWKMENAYKIMAKRPVRRDKLEYLDVDGRIILERVIEKSEWTLVARIGTSGGLC